MGFSGQSLYRKRVAAQKESLLEEAEKLLQDVSYDQKHRLARLYRERLLEIYRQEKDTAKEKQLLWTMLMEAPGNKKVLQAYKNCFSKEEWKEALEQKVFAALKDKKEALPLFAREKRYDLLMTASEESGQITGKVGKSPVQDLS